MARGKQKEAEPTFEERLARLEEIVEQLESGEVGLDDSLRLYAEGADLIRRCRADLQAAEQRIEQLTRTAEGDLVVEPIEPPETNGTEAGEDEG